MCLPSGNTNIRRRNAKLSIMRPCGAYTLRMTTKDVFATIKEMVKTIALKNHNLTNVTGSLLTKRSILS